MYHSACLRIYDHLIQISFVAWFRETIISIGGRNERGNTEMANSGSQMRLAVLGAGKMGGILIEAFVKQGIVSAKDISATVQRAGVDRKTLGSLSITLGTDNRAAVRDADVILLCVKPHF